MNTTFFCDLAALTPQQRQRHRALSEQLRPFVYKFQELPNGYAALIKSSTSLESEINEFLVLEKLCCPFFTLKLDLEASDADSGHKYRVHITGPGDIKPFIRAEFRIPQPESAAQQDPN